MSTQRISRCRSPIVLIAVFLAVTALSGCGDSSGGTSNPDGTETTIGDATSSEVDVDGPELADATGDLVDTNDPDVVDPDVSNPDLTDVIPAPPEKSHGSLGAPAESYAKGTSLRLRGKLTPGFSAPTASGATYTLHHLSLQR